MHLETGQVRLQVPLGTTKEMSSVRLHCTMQAVSHSYINKI